MNFKNLICYRLKGDLPQDFTNQLERGLFRNCGPNEVLTRGWIPVRDNLIYTQGQHQLIALKVEEKILPSSVVNRVTKERAEEIANQQGYAPGRKQMRELKERVTEELLPRAFTKQRVTYAWIDRENGRFMVDAGTNSKADELIEHLRMCFDEFPLAMIDTQLSATSLMADWLASGDAGDSRFTIDRDCELKEVSEEKATVRYVHHPLDIDETRSHLASGKLPTKLAMTFNDRVSFVLTHEGFIKRIALLDIVKDDAQADTADEQFDADFAINTGELARLINALIENLGGEKDEE